MTSVPIEKIMPDSDGTVVKDYTKNCEARTGDSGKIFED